MSEQAQCPACGNFEAPGRGSFCSSCIEAGWDRAYRRGADATSLILQRDTVRPIAEERDRLRSELAVALTEREHLATAAAILFELRDWDIKPDCDLGKWLEAERARRGVKP